MGTPRGDLNSGLPRLALDGPTTARWQEQADVRAFVFDHAQAEDEARRMTGDDRSRSGRRPSAGPCAARSPIWCSTHRRLG
ncbi:hypothetical protein [Microbacterium sp. LWH3-1.2]|uniref:hypothetical protein n=1 Tax=Microbacterium sp. LWH3-1.2 TaxID=3135256 RepID=UPI00343C0238